MKRLLGLVLIVLLVLALLFHRQITVGTRAILFITQNFPQVPVKPLEWTTRAPVHRHVSFASPAGTVIADLFLPRPWLGGVALHSDPAIIVATGVKIPPGAMPSFLNLGNSLARLGYVTLIPRLRALQNGHVALEDPETYVRSFTYLAGLHDVDPHRITYAGFSVGSSVALVAAANPHIARRVRALIFFAGYENVFAYLISVATKEEPYHGHVVAWQPSASAVQQTKSVVRTAGASDLLRLFQARTVRRARRVLASAPAGEVRRMRRFNPAAALATYRAPTFILDDKGDAYVPYVESYKLRNALPPRQVKAFLLTPVFQHVLPGPGGLGRLAGGFFGVFGFLYSVLAYL